MDKQFYLPKLRDEQNKVFSYPINNLIATNFTSSINQVDLKNLRKIEVTPIISPAFTINDKLLLDGKSFICVGDLRCGRRPIRETDCSTICIHQGLMSKGQIFPITEVTKTLATQLYCDETGETSTSVFDALCLRRAYCFDEVFIALLQNRIVTVMVHSLSEDSKTNQKLFLNITGISANKFCIDDPRTGRHFKVISRICQAFESAWIW